MKNKENLACESPETLKRFRHLFEYYGESQKKFGARFNLDQSYLSTIFAGKRKISGTVLKEMAKKGVDIQWLMTGEGRMFMKEENMFSTGNEASSRSASTEVSKLKDELIQSLKDQVKQLKEALDRSAEMSVVRQSDHAQRKEEIKENLNDHQ